MWHDVSYVSYTTYCEQDFSTDTNKVLVQSLTFSHLQMFIPLLFKTPFSSSPSSSPFLLYSIHRKTQKRHKETTVLIKTVVWINKQLSMWESRLDSLLKKFDNILKEQRKQWDSVCVLSLILRPIVSCTKCDKIVGMHKQILWLIMVCYSYVHKNYPFPPPPPPPPSDEANFS